MDVGETNGWLPDEVVPAAEVLARVQAVYPLEPVARAERGEVAERWRYLDGRGELGLITSVTKPFCGDCTRARLSAVGELYTCLFASTGTDLRAVLRCGADDAALYEAVAGRWRARDDRYSEVRGTAPAAAARAQARDVLPRRLSRCALTATARSAAAGSTPPPPPASAPRAAGPPGATPRSAWAPSSRTRGRAAAGAARASLPRRAAGRCPRVRRRRGGPARCGRPRDARGDRAGGAGRRRRGRLGRRRRGGASFFLAFAARVTGGVLQGADDAVDAGFFALDALPELAFSSTRGVVARTPGAPTG